MKNGEQGAFAMVDPSSGAAQCGLTKRECFAAMAMQGILASSHKISISNGIFANEAGVAVAIADELLKQLEK